MMTTSEQVWWIGPLISGLALIAVIWFGWGQHKVRVWRNRTPFDAYLTLGEDEADEYWNLHIPAHSKMTIQLRMRPRLNYKQLHIMFGFLGDIDKRPVPHSVFNGFYS
jgi:hypothetical protein